MHGTLYIVATPIGNLQDTTLRALKILTGVDGIVCEDTRRTNLLLNNYQIKKPLLALNDFNELKVTPKVIDKLKEGRNIALVSDSGTPLVSDPGFKLVRECIKEGIKVESIPGPSSVLAALTVSGLPTDKFLFLGFLPKKEGHRKKLLQNLNNVLQVFKTTVIFFETPHRLLETLSELEETFGDTEITICRELTKIHEEVRREKNSESISHFQKVKPKGEFTILF